MKSDSRSPSVNECIVEFTSETGHTLRHLFHRLVEMSVQWQNNRKPLQCDPQLVCDARQFMRRMCSIANNMACNIMFEYDHHELNSRLDGNVYRVLEKFRQERASLVAPYTSDWGTMSDSLIQQAPSKLIDGYWLQAISNCEGLRDEQRQKLMSIYEEERGEGYSHMSHDRIYRDLLESAAIELPDVNDEQFAMDCRIRDESFMNPCIQLSLSILQEELLPELLGFTMQFEEIALSLLVMRDATRHYQLPHLYYTLHITIDNAVSGHGSMVRNVVHQFMEQNNDDVRHKWHRILTGYCLATFWTYSDLAKQKPEALLLPMCGHETQQRMDLDDINRGATPHEKMLRILERYRPYLSCVVLHPSFKDMQNQTTENQSLLEQLASSPFIVAGHPERSHLVSMFEFGQPMFRAITTHERDVMQEWIKSLPTETGQTRSSQQHAAFFYLLISVLIMSLMWVIMKF